MLFRLARERYARRTAANTQTLLGSKVSIPHLIIRWRHVLKQDVVHLRKTKKGEETDCALPLDGHVLPPNLGLWSHQNGNIKHEVNSRGRDPKYSTVYRR